MKKKWKATTTTTTGKNIVEKNQIDRHWWWWKLCTFTLSSVFRGLRLKMGCFWFIHSLFSFHVCGLCVLLINANSIKSMANISSKYVWVCEKRKKNYVNSGEWRKSHILIRNYWDSVPRTTTTAHTHHFLTEANDNNREQAARITSFNETLFGELFRDI